MPLIRWITAKDVDLYGELPVDVPEVTARRVVADRRAVRLTQEEIRALDAAQPEPDPAE